MSTLQITNKLILDMLRQARERLSRGYAKGAMARKKLGNLSAWGETTSQHVGNSWGINIPLDLADDGKTTDVCAIGALMHIARRKELNSTEVQDLRNRCEEALRPFLPEGSPSLIEYSDHPETRKPNILEVFNSGIKALEEQLSAVV